MRPWFLCIFPLLCMMPHGGEAEEGVGAGVDSIATYSWVAEKEYREDACDILAYTRYYPLDTCFCGWEECKVWSKSGANTITQKDFALTDTSCQNPKKAEVVITGITGTCLNSWGTYYKYEFAGDGPGTVAEVFATTTCDPGTSTGQHRYWKSSTCEGGGNGYQGEEPESWKDVCVAGKLNSYLYPTADCASGGKLYIDAAMGECWARDDTGYLLKSGC